MDGYICQALPSAASLSLSPSKILSDYFSRPVHMICRGPTRRPCSPTEAFPDLPLSASTDFPDGYPLLLMSEESVESVQRAVRGQVGTQGIDEMWEKQSLVIERSVSVAKVYLPSWMYFWRTSVLCFLRLRVRVSRRNLFSSLF